MVESFLAKKEKTFDFSTVFILVEVTGFEPATFWSRTHRATKLRYTSKMEPMKGLEPLTLSLIHIYQQMFGAYYLFGRW